MWSFLFESAFLDQVSDTEAYLIYVIVVKDEKKSRKNASTSKHSIDAYHRQFIKNTWASKEQLKTLISFNTFEEIIK